MCPEQVRRVAAGAYHTVALTNDGRVFAWGDGRSGALGTGRVDKQTVPTQVEIAAPDVKFTEVAAGVDFTLLLSGIIVYWPCLASLPVGEGASFYPSFRQR